MMFNTACKTCKTCYDIGRVVVAVEGLEGVISAAELGIFLANVGTS